MTLFRDIQSRSWLYAKGALFVLLAAVAGGMLLLHTPELRVFVLLWICVWASCRAYYFAFYVIEHYVDPSFRFSGLLDFLRYAVSSRGSHHRTGQRGQSRTHE